MRMLPIALALSALSLPCQASAVSDAVVAGKITVPAISYGNLPVEMIGILRPLHLKMMNGIVPHASQCTKDCEIVYRHCKAVGAPNCENNYNACYNSCD